jgi:hypothetical protein
MAYACEIDNNSSKDGSKHSFRPRLHNGQINRLSTEKRAQIIGCLVEGNSIRATVRMTGAAKNTITKLLGDLGEACADYQDQVLRDLPCKVVEARGRGPAHDEDHLA